MIKLFMRTLAVGGVMILTAGSALTENIDGLDINETTHDFGHVGIDYTLYCDFVLVNNRPETLQVEQLVPDCDCTQVWVTDSSIAPGGTLLIHSRFSTKDYYGPTGRPFTVNFSNRLVPDPVFWHRAVVGQWYYGLKPDPISLFFLPPHKSHKVVVHNENEKKISLTYRGQVDTTFVVNLLKTEAESGEELEFEVIPHPNLAAGTYQSNFSVEVCVEGGAKPAILTIPVKIVRY